MSSIFSRDLFERLIFTVIVIGILMAVFSAFKFIDISNQLANNQAAQIHAAGEQISPTTQTEVQGLVASDLERRRLVNERFNILVIGGFGLAFIGGGWIMSDLMRSRKKQGQAQAKAVAEAGA